MIDLAALPDAMKRARLTAAVTQQHANTLVITAPVERGPYRLLLSELGPPVRVSPVLQMRCEIPGAGPRPTKWRSMTFAYRSAARIRGDSAAGTEHRTEHAEPNPEPGTWNRQYHLSMSICGEGW